MHPFLSVANLFGLGAPELIAVLIILLVLFSGAAVSGRDEGGAHRGSDPRLTPYEKQILLAVGAVLAVGIGIVVWQKITR